MISVNQQLIVVIWDRDGVSKYSRLIEIRFSQTPVGVCVLCVHVRRCRMNSKVQGAEYLSWSYRFDFCVWCIRRPQKLETLNSAQNLVLYTGIYGTEPHNFI